MASNIDDLGNDFIEMLKRHAQEFGIELKADLDETRLYMQQRLAHLASIAGQPGYARAAEAEAHNVLMKATLNGIDSARKADRRITRIWASVLEFAGRALDVVL